MTRADLERVAQVLRDAGLTRDPAHQGARVHLTRTDPGIVRALAALGQFEPAFVIRRRTDGSHAVLVSSSATVGGVVFDAQCTRPATAEEVALVQEVPSTDTNRPTVEVGL